MEHETRLAELQQRFGEPGLYKDPDALAELEEQIESLSDDLAALDEAWHDRAEEQT